MQQPKETEEMIEAINNDTRKKIYYYLAFGFIAIEVWFSFYLLLFEMFTLFLKTITFSLDDISKGEKAFFNIHPAIIFFGVGGGMVASFIFGFFEKLRTVGVIIMILLAGICDAFVFLVIGEKDGGELAILVTILSVIILIFIVLYFKEKRDSLT